MKPLTENEDAAAAEARLLRARIGLAMRCPFLSSALMRLPFRAVPDADWCPTLATDGYRIFHNPAWTLEQSPAGLRGVLAHELLHVLFEHSSRRGRRHPVLWNIACDHAINLLLDELGFHLPEGVLMNRRFVGLPAEAIYARLEEGSRYPAMPWLAQYDLDNPAEHGPDVPGTVSATGPDLLDADDPRLAGLRRPQDADAEQQRELMVELRREARQELAGSAAAWFATECATAERASVDWRAELRTWMHDRIRNDWSLWPPSKRHVHRGLFLPSVGVESPGHVVFAIDTSASMSMDELADAFAEVRQFREVFPCRLSIVQADAAIQGVDEFGAMDGLQLPERLSVKGRGGTDFRPVFNWCESNAEASCVLIYATDGFGHFPAAPPPWPVVWLRTPHGLPAERFPYGRVLTPQGA